MQGQDNNLQGQRVSLTEEQLRFVSKGAPLNQQDFRIELQGQEQVEPDMKIDTPIYDSTIEIKLTPEGTKTPARLIPSEAEVNETKFRSYPNANMTLKDLSPSELESIGIDLQTLKMANDSTIYWKAFPRKAEEILLNSTDEDDLAIFMNGTRMFVERLSRHEKRVLLQELFRTRTSEEWRIW